MGTYLQTKEDGDKNRRWLLVDAEGKTLGRLASQIAALVRGKHKATYTPSVDGGDFVVVINAGKVRLTGAKLETKVYRRHSGYIGGLKSMTAGTMLQKHPTRLIEEAVKGMLPKGNLGKRMSKKLKVYAGAEHPHKAQQPEVFTTK